MLHCNEMSMKCLCFYPIVLIAIFSGTNHKIYTVEFIPLLLTTSSCVLYSGSVQNKMNENLILT